MASYLKQGSTSPMGEINTTPLIDVMLVLLIMFVITIPVATHSLDFDLPGDKPVDIKPDPVSNKVSITQDGRILWNANKVDEVQLAGLLKATRALPTEPQLQFEPDSSAGYGQSARVLQIIKASEVSNFGFVGNDRYAEFGSTKARQ